MIRSFVCYCGFIFVFLVKTSSSLSSNVEVKALCDIYNTLHPVFSSPWPSTLCEWDIPGSSVLSGITCTGDGLHVTEMFGIILGSFIFIIYCRDFSTLLTPLIGPIPPSIGNFSMLELL